MPQLGELLERFRHTATPGPPAAAGGVPVDAVADLQAEVRPLIAALDEVEDETRALVEAATAEAAAVRERGAREAESILSEARLQAARLRAAPPDEAPDDEARAILAEAGAEADEIRRRARRRIPGLVALVMSCLGDDVEAASPVREGGSREESGVAGLGRG